MVTTHLDDSKEKPLRESQQTTPSFSSYFLQGFSETPFIMQKTEAVKECCG